MCWEGRTSAGVLHLKVTSHQSTAHQHAVENPVKYSVMATQLGPLAVVGFAPHFQDRAAFAAPGSHFPHSTNLTEYAPSCPHVEHGCRQEGFCCV